MEEEEHEFFGGALTYEAVEIFCLSEFGFYHSLVEEKERVAFRRFINFFSLFMELPELGHGFQPMSSLIATIDLL